MIMFTVWPQYQKHAMFDINAKTYAMRRDTSYAMATYTHTQQTKYYTHIKVKQDKNKNSVKNYESRTQF